MAINTIDGFYIGSATPIDTRITAANTSERTSIVYKYDGLKVLQLDTRDNWVWNASNNSWELDSNTVDISGPANNLAKYNSGTGLTYSNIYNLPDKVGIRTASPNSVFQINGQSGDNFNIYLDGANGVMMSTNWFYHFDSSTNVYTSSNPSVQFKLTTQGGIQVRSREANGNTGDFTTYFEIHDPNGFNFLRSPGNGTFISGSMSVGTGASAYITQQLLYSDGPVRFDSGLHKSTSFVYWNGTNFTRYRGYATNGSLPTSTNIGSSYTIGSQEHEVIINSSQALCSVSLPTLSGTSHDIGREISISLEGGLDTAIVNITSGTNIIGTSGIQIDPAILYRGETMRFVSVNTANGARWKQIDYITKSTEYPETWKSIGGGGSFANGQSVPGFHPSNSVQNSGITGRQDLRVRKIDEEHIHIQGSLLVNTVAAKGGNNYDTNIFNLPTGYKPLKNVYFDGLMDDDGNETFIPGQFLVGSSGIVKFIFYGKGVGPTLGDSYLNIDAIVPID